MRTAVTLACLLLVLLTGCAPAEAATEPPPSATFTPAPESSLAPYDLPDTPTATLEPSPTPLPDLTGISVYSVAHLDGGKMQITFAGVPAALDLMRFLFKVDGQEYTCGRQAAYPDRLYCQGADLPAGKTVVIVVLLAGDPPLLLWQGQEVVPAFAAAPEPPAAGGASGPAVWVWCGPPPPPTGGPIPADCGDRINGCPPTGSAIVYGYYCLNGDYNQMSAPIPVSFCSDCTFDCTVGFWVCTIEYAPPGWPPPPPPLP